MVFSMPPIFNKQFLLCFVVPCCLLVLSCATTIKDQTSVAGFIQQMVEKHHFDANVLSSLFDNVELKDEIIAKITKPSETLPWHRYRKIFLKQPRITAGVQFWRENAQTLRSVEQETGVPAQIIVAIIGVETFYGQHVGLYRVIDALSTLAFAYPPRSPFFRDELENFLLLCQKEKINPLTPVGSYAGAMGIPQFMPSSYIKYSIDFNKDNYRDIWHNPQDTIASVGNYLAKHGWQKGQTIASKIGDKVQKKLVSLALLKEGLRNIKSNSENPNISTPLLSTQKAKIIALEQEDGEELWATSENFYVITRYNHSPLYAMAVYQLSLALANQFPILSFSSPYEKDYYSGFCLDVGCVFELSG